jgi:uncharacterized membrane protein
MSHLPFAILAYFLNSIAVLIDKYQLSKNLPSPLLYVFYISAFSLMTLVALPFTSVPSMEVWSYASFATLLWTVGAYCMFSALKVGQATRVIPVIGVLTPLFLLMWSFIQGLLTPNQVWGVLLLVIGLLFLVINDLKGKITKKESFFELGAALLFAVSYTLLHEAYSDSNFLTVFVWAKLVLIPIGILLLIIPKSRKIVLPKQLSTHHTGSPQKLLWKSKVGLLFLIGQACGGTSEMLLSYSISLATPALVNSLQGIQYASLFLFGLLLSKKFPKIYGEKYSPMIILFKVIGIVIIALGLYVLAISIQSTTVKKLSLGVTFSPRFAAEIGLDPKEAYIRSLDATQIKRVRLPVYWDEVEKEPDNYNFAENTFYIEEAKKRGVEIILVVGQKQPRWPECFIPDWAENLPRDERYKRIIRLVAKEIGYFKQYDNITHWQVENESMFEFGLCDKPDKKTLELLKNEVAVVKALDPRPIIITDSGELSSWKSVLPVGDVFGTTMYRSSWNPYFGYIVYPTPPLMYPLKARIMEWILNTHPKQKMVAELQAEPWAKGTLRIIDMPIEDQMTAMSIRDMEDNITFAGQTGFDPVYLWGIEWWYWMSINGHPEYLEIINNVVNDLK